MSTQIVLEEGADLALALEFTDRYGDPVTPASAAYQIDCLTTKAVIKESTPLTAPASTHELKVDGVVSAIQDSANPFEIHRVIVSAVASDGFRSVTKIEIKVNNTKG